jgi:hypothetical protein
MKSIDQVGITYVNMVLGRGLFNGVCNIQLGAYLFSSIEDGSKIDPDPAVACRQLHSALGELIAQVEKAKGVTNSAESVEGRPN